MRILTACIYYTVAKVEGFVLLDVDFIPLQGEYWQTDQMLSAYFKLLSTRFSTPNQRRMSLDFTTVGAIMTGSGVRDHLEKNKSLPLSSVCNNLTKVSVKFRDHINILIRHHVFYLQAAYRKVGEAEVIFGPYHKNGNHWTLVLINFVTKQLLYIDPLGPPDEQSVADNFSYCWLEWALLHNSGSEASPVPTTLTAITTKHALQRDSRNCGIFTMCVSN